MLVCLVTPWAGSLRGVIMGRPGRREGANREGEGEKEKEYFKIVPYKQ